MDDNIDSNDAPSLTWLGALLVGLAAGLAASVPMVGLAFLMPHLL